METCSSSSPIHWGCSCPTNSLFTVLEGDYIILIIIQDSWIETWRKHKSSSRLERGYLTRHRSSHQASTMSQRCVLGCIASNGEPITSGKPYAFEISCKGEADTQAFQLTANSEIESQRASQMIIHSRLRRNLPSPSTNLECGYFAVEPRTACGFFAENCEKVWLPRFQLLVSRSLESLLSSTNSKIQVKSSCYSW